MSLQSTQNVPGPPPSCFAVRVNEFSNDGNPGTFGPTVRVLGDLTARSGSVSIRVVTPDEIFWTVPA